MSSACALKTTVLVAGSQCPGACKNQPSGACVLFKTKSLCQALPSTQSGNCTTGDEFPLQGATECVLTYTCPNLHSRSKDDKLFWHFSVADFTISTDATFAGAPIDELGSLGSDEFASVQSFQLTGNGFTSPKGAMRTITYPPGLFGTATHLTRLYFVNMNLSGTLAPGVTGLLPNSLEQLSLVNAGLTSLPLDVKAMPSLAVLNMTDNNLASVPVDSITKVRQLLLAGNALTSMPEVPPTVQILDLSRNKLTSFPYTALSVTGLQELWLQGNALSNVVLDDTQTTQLRKLKTFSADFTVTTCPAGSGVAPDRLKALTSAQFCFKGVESADANSSMSSVAIVLIALGSVVIVALGVFCFFRHRRQAGAKGKNGRRTSLGTDGTGGTSNHYVSADSHYRDTTSLGLLSDPELLAVRIDYQEVQEIQLISRGGFGEVWSGIYLGRPVAIKRLLPEKRTWDDAMNFAMEIKMMTRLNHPKIVEFIGAAWSNALSIQAICEYMNCGDLKSLLDRSSTKNDANGTVLTWANIKLHLAIDVADALVYLHSLNPKFIHRDLKSRNILIDAENGAKLSDFGISRNRNLEDTMTAGVGTCRWMAPEVIQGAHYDEAVDIYSFGCVLSEMDTCNVPYFDATHTNGSKLQDHAIMAGVVQGTLKPSFTKDCPKEIVAIAVACLETDPKKRPTSTQLSYLLRKYRKESERLNDTNST
ncbi:TKL protein kinase [Saprolegnia diclina VS20]|uniref:TKL protein kinase n=1 Tax=Saprolegnia diclina (strain VS20) TaxID=1156394 RepID=T0QGX9_SAPDV|nr:TKL protein kinase [Saprolegnia diclina VS20]EQC37229.1 TKL protein kinase [Saprolegnia diclina VS20]|eukprot:XP_008609391.1 TKL protein kinase [Saprolegnia diclina VS20]